MKLRRILAAAVAASLGLTLGMPALAADPADARLAAVATKVIHTLDIPDDYTSFHGEPNETPLGTRWQLSWDGENKGLNVSATEEGKVLSMNCWDNDVVIVRNSGYGPTFPAMTRQEAEAKARDFLALVLTEGEEAVFNAQDYGDTLGVTSYSFWGGVHLNGLESPLSISVHVRAADGKVTSFWRDDPSQYAGKLVGPDTVTTDAKARDLLRGTLEMKLEYVLADREDENAPKTAVLRYLPLGTHEFYVDAATGKLVDLTELREKLRSDYTGGADNKYFVSADAAMEAPEAAPEESKRGLTEAELAGVAKLEGVLTQEELDAAIRQWPQLGLDGFQVAGSSLRVDKDGEKVTAQVIYARNTDLGIARRTVTLDGHTGELESMGGYDPYDKNDPKTDLKTARAKADAFLKALWPDQFAKTNLYNEPSVPATRSGAYYFNFAQKVNGYFYPGNSITVRVSAADGSVIGFSKSFDEEVAFDSAEGIVSLDTAIAAWCGTYPVKLAYIAVPVELNLLGKEVMPLRNAGYDYYNALRPGYQLGQQEGWYLGVDAKTGQAVKGKSVDRERMTYDDVAGHWAADALLELAQYSVGWYGGKARPADALTQLDYVAFLASADGYGIIPGKEGYSKEDVDNLYSYAVRRGLLTQEERSESKILTRAEAVKLLLDSLGYKKVAGLKGIFRTDFTDGDTIAEEQLGYAALAQALNIVNGDSRGRFDGDRAATRAEGAVMLWQYMKQ